MYVLEKNIERQVVKVARARFGVRSIKLSNNCDSGWPDRQFLIPGGRPLFIEFKRPGEELRPLQVHIFDELKKLNYEVQVHDNVREALNAIFSALETTRLSTKCSEMASQDFSSGTVS